jgi:hypothetical protein
MQYGLIETRSRPWGGPGPRSIELRSEPCTAPDRHGERALSSEPGARSYSFRSPEDVVLRKLEWYRAGGEVSDRQSGDTVGVLKVQGSAVDRAYLQRWAGHLGIGDLLDRALAEASSAG